MDYGNYEIFILLLSPKLAVAVPNFAFLNKNFPTVPSPFHDTTANTLSP